MDRSGKTALVNAVLIQIAAMWYNKSNENSDAENAKKGDGWSNCREYEYEIDPMHYVIELWAIKELKLRAERRRKKQ